MDPGIRPRAHRVARQLGAADERQPSSATEADSAPRSPTERIAPRTWLILGDKAGDNAQVRIVADALGWPFVVKDLVFRAPYVIGKPHFRASLYHIDRARSARLEPPWPDLILTVGRRPSMAALWVKAQAQGRRQTGRGRSSQAPARPLRSGDRTAAVPAPEPPQRAASGSAADARGRGCGRDRGRRLARPIRRPASTAGRAARGRPDQAVRVRPDGRQAPDRPMPARSPRPRAGPCTSRPAAARRLR